VYEKRPNPSNKKIIQIHPSLQCNLFCKHCYSNSGPYVPDNNLKVESLLNVISDAAELGYNTVSFSGGEPLTYKGLERLLTHCKSLGLGTSVTTNGTLFTTEKLQKLKGLVDLLAISLDGPPKLHNEMRASVNAFELLTNGVDAVKKIGLCFGFIHTLTRESWEHLLWIAQFAKGYGASLLQIHPLEIVGRAESLMQSSYAYDDVVLRAYILLMTLAMKYQNSMPIQFDVLNRDYVKENPATVYAANYKFEDCAKNNFADLINPLIVEADGTVVPLSYGFSKDYAICNITTQRLSRAKSEYILNGNYSKFRKLCKELFTEIINSKEIILFNWYELITRRSQELQLKKQMTRKLDCSFP
jgi:Fe-coproporphyrin III synthase